MRKYEDALHTQLSRYTGCL